MLKFWKHKWSAVHGCMLPILEKKKPSWQPNQRLYDIGKNFTKPWQELNLCGLHVVISWLDFAWLEWALLWPVDLPGVVKLDNALLPLTLALFLRHCYTVAKLENVYCKNWYPIKNSGDKKRCWGYVALASLRGCPNVTLSLSIRIRVRLGLED